MNERTAKMIEMRKTMTLQEIADMYGITRERVRQIIGAKKREINPKHEFIKSNPGLTNRELAELTDFRTQTIMRVRRGQRHAIDGGPSEKGTTVEDMVSSRLAEMGIKHRLMPHNDIYDIELENGKTIDVKSTYKISYPPSSIGYPFYRFRAYKIGVEDKKKYCQYFIFVVVPTGEMYIIPREEVGVENRITTGGYRTKWDKYLENWEQLR